MMATSPLEWIACVWDEGLIGTGEGWRGPLIKGRYVPGRELPASGIVEPAGCPGEALDVQLFLFTCRQAGRLGFVDDRRD